MSKYETNVSKDGHNFARILINAWFRPAKVIWNPTDEDFKGTIISNYNETNICYVCREENNITDKSILYPGNTGRNTDKDGKK